MGGHNVNIDIMWGYERVWGVGNSHTLMLIIVAISPQCKTYSKRGKVV